MSTYTQILYQIIYTTRNMLLKTKKSIIKGLLKEHEIEFDEKYLL